MRITILNAYFEPETAPTNYLCTHLCEALTQEGHLVTLFVPTPTRGVDQHTRRKTPARELRQGGRWRVQRLGLPGEGTRPVLRAVRYAMLEARFLLAALRAPTDVYFLYSTPPTQGLLGALLRLLTRRRVVYNVQDLFPESLVGTGMARKSSRLFRAGLIMERFAYARIDTVVTISEAFAKVLRERGARDVRVVRNWVDAAEIFPVPKSHNWLRQELGIPEDAFCIAYSGNIGHTQNLGLLLDAARMLPQVHFAVIGNGARAAEFAELVSRRSLTNITLAPFQDYARISEVFSLGEAGLVISKAGVGSNSIPSKTWGIMAAGRPVVASFDEDSELAGLLRATRAGCCVPAGSLDELVQVVDSLQRNPQTARSMGENGRRYIESNLSRESGTRELMETLTHRDSR